MRSLVVYESLYGNTAAVARAIAEGLGEQGEVTLATTAEAVRSVLDAADLLVVGTPTHAWGLPRERTWGSVPEGRAAHPCLVRSWLADVPEGHGRPAAAFATRIDKPQTVTGSAANGLARRLGRRGWSTGAAVTSFLVAGSEGPLVDGELDRARSWGAQVGRVADRKRIVSGAASGR